MPSIKALRSDVKEYVLSAEAEKHFLGIDHGPKWWLVLEGVYYYMKHEWNSFMCLVFHHHWVDCGSYANGESAKDVAYCKRCGAHFEHTYY